MSNARIPVKTRLRRWNLSRVPFPSLPFVDYFNEDPLVNGSVFAPELRQQQIDQLRTEVLCNGYADAVKSWSWVWAHKRVGGSMGMGKSALLGYITDQINSNFGSSFFHQAAPWLVVYAKVSEKVQSTAQVLATVLASIHDTGHGMSVERRLVSRLRHKAIALNTPHQYSPSLSAESEAQLADDTWLDSQGVQLEDLNKAVSGLLKQEGVRAAVADAFARCALKDVFASYTNDVDNPTSKLSHPQEVFSILLNDVAKIVRAAGLLHLTIILDDFYFLVKNTRAPAKEALAAEWRDIVVDGGYRATRGNVFNWIAVMHTRTAGNFNQAWENARMNNTAPLFLKVGDTMGRPGVHLHALPKELGRQLIESYLKYSRTGRAPSTIYPFNEDALMYILEYARQKGQEQEGRCDPSSLVETAQIVFVRALFDANEHSEIDITFVRHVLEGIPLPIQAQPASGDAIEAADEAAIAPSEGRMPLDMVCACACHAEEGTFASDLVALISGGADKTLPGSIIGYVCLRCNAPVDITDFT